MKGRPKKTTIIPSYCPRADRWMIDIPASMGGGKRQRRYFSTQHEALTDAGKVAMSVASGQEISAPYDPQGLNLKKMAAAYLKLRETETSQSNFDSLRWALNAFVLEFGKKEPNQVTPDAIDDWLASTSYSTRGRFNLFAGCRTFYNWRQIRAVCPVNPFQDAPPKQDKGHRLEILTPDQMRTLLDLDLKPFFKAWIVCGGFSGMRSCEFERLSYEAIDYDHLEIVIRKDQSKQGEAARPRSIPIYAAFKRHMPSGEGPLDGGMSWKKVDDEMEKALKALGWKHWKKNSLRHSFASYALSASQDAVKTAYEMGHASPTLLYKTYANAVTRKDAASWFAL